MGDSQEDHQMTEDVTLETPVEDVFIPPSIIRDSLLTGDTYTYFSPIPPSLLPSDPDQPSRTSSVDGEGSSLTTEAAPLKPGTPCCLGVDEAGRGPVLGPMVYGVFFLPLTKSDPLLRQQHHFDDSKVLTPAVRSSLMQALCTPSTTLHSTCGWAISALSARDISSNMLRPQGVGAYNLNAQAMDATIDLIKGVIARGVNVREIYVDTVGPPATYQKKLERVFPTAKITVAKKADSLYPCVSAASVCAKVTRDAALEVLFDAQMSTAEPGGGEALADEAAAMTGPQGWGSGYPSDARCVTWLRNNIHPVFGWGSECRFSWGTAKDMIEAKGAGVKIDWPVEDDVDNTRLTDYFGAGNAEETEVDELGAWFGSTVGVEAF
jgi:ribonuclease H2 subunit A